MYQSYDSNGRPAGQGLRRDGRPQRITKPSMWYLLIAVIFTPGSLAIPFVGIPLTIIGWILIARRYVFAKRDAEIAYGHFRSED